MSRYQKLTGFSFFFFIETFDMKRKQKKNIYIIIVIPLALCPCHVTSCQSSLQSHGKQEVLSQNCSTVSIQAVHCVPYVSSHCSLCLAGTGGTGTGSRVHPCRLRWQAIDEQPLLALAVSHSLYLLSVTLPP